MTADTLGDRMKELERAEAGRALDYPVCIRLDGRSFHAFTRGLARPYDARLSAMMIDLTKALVDETGARIGYTQSDEISLVLVEPPGKTTEGYFGLRAQKLASITAAFASAWFTCELCRDPARIAERRGQAPLFDARAWSVPSLTDAAAVLLWRELDARKNAITMAASAFYAHRDLLNRSGEEKIEMLRARGVDFDAYPAFFRRGTYVTRVATRRPFTADEIHALPEKHHARRRPDLVVERHVLQELELRAPLARITNRAAVLFEGAEALEP